MGLHAENDPDVGEAADRDGALLRNNTEHVLFGVRGTLRTLQRNVPTAFTAARTNHSAKPGVFYEIVERMSPGPYWSCSPASSGRAGRLWATRLTDGPLMWS